MSSFIIDSDIIYKQKSVVFSVAEPGCLSRILDPSFFPFRIPDPGVKKAPDLGFRIRNAGGIWGEEDASIN